MNFSRYCSVYSRFHGATSYRTQEDVIILDLAEEPFDNWILMRMYQFDDIHARPDHAFVKALQMHLQSQASLTVFCHGDTWIALSGRDTYVTPIVADHANFQMYATPYFVRDPSTLADHMQAHHCDTVFGYKNCVVYLDRQDLPYPGGCYFNTSTPSSLYRICVLSREPVDVAIRVATEWRTRRDVLTLPYPTTDATLVPAMIPFKPMGYPYLPNARIASTGNIQKRLSLHQPQCLIQDILASYQRNAQSTIRNVGLVVEWPLRVTFEGTRTDTGGGQFVALVANGMKPTRVLLVRYPYEVYTEYAEVPTIPYVSFQYAETFLELPPDMEKVSIDSTVIGYKYEQGFFCFSFPLLEGRPTASVSRNVDCLCTPPKNHSPEDEVVYTFRVDDRHVVHKIKSNTGVFHGWYLSVTDDAHLSLEADYLPKLVSEWLRLFEAHDEKVDQPVNVKTLQMALTLARHKICFKTNIVTHVLKPDHAMVVTDQEIEINQSAEEASFVNSRRVELATIEGASDEQDASCNLM